MEVKTLVDTLNFVTKVVETSSVNLDVKSGVCTISAANNTSACSKSFKCKESNMRFCMDTGVLLGIIGNANEIQLQPKNSAVEFKCGRRSGVLSTLTYNPVQVVSDEAQTTFQFNKDTKEQILNNLPKVLMKPAPYLPEEDSLLNIMIKSDGKKIHLLTADDLHSIYYSEDFKGKKFDLHIPLNYANIISSMDSDFDLGADINSLYITNKTTKIKLQQVAAKQLVTVDDFINNFAKKPVGDKIENINIEDLTEAVDSTYAVKTSNTDLLLNVKKGRLYSTCESELGIVKSPIMNVDKKVKDFSGIVNYDIFMDIVRFFKKDMNVVLNEKYMTTIKEEKKTNAIQLGIVCFAAKS